MWTERPEKPSIPAAKIFKKDFLRALDRAGTKVLQNARLLARKLLVGDRDLQQSSRDGIERGKSLEPEKAKGEDIECRFLLTEERRYDSL